MKSQFQSLQAEDPATVFLVRRVSKMGLNGASILRQYFSRFGPVKDVHTTVTNQARGKGKPRLGHLAFVVMETSAAAYQILQQSEHVCQGLQITVKAFQALQPKAGCGDFTEAPAANLLTSEKQETENNAPQALRENVLGFPHLASAQSRFPSDAYEFRPIIQMSL